MLIWESSKRNKNALYDIQTLLLPTLLLFICSLCLQMSFIYVLNCQWGYLNDPSTSSRKSETVAIMNAICHKQVKSLRL